MTVKKAFTVILFAGFMSLVASLKPRVKRQDEETPVIFPEIEDINENSCFLPDGKEGTCRPAGLCVFQIDTQAPLDRTACTTADDELGVCCPTKPPPSRGTVFGNPSSSVNLPDISGSDLNSAGEEGLSIVQKIDQLEMELRRKGLFIQRGTIESFHQALFGGNKKKISLLGRNGLIGVEATLRLVETFHLNSIQGSKGLPRFSLTNTVIKDTCPKPPPCPPSKYRTFDGSCNNLNHPSWGKSYSPFQRLLSPRYFDGINAPRIAYDGGPLPSAREVSYRIIPDQNIPSSKFTLLVMQWGQFLDHDLSLTALSAASNGEGIVCCAEEIQRNPRLLHPACLPIHIPRNDPFFSKFGLNCMEFVRSIAAPRSDCTFGPREQLNQLTAFIDGSMIYGSSENESKMLRSFNGGKLKHTNLDGVELLPMDIDRDAECMNDRDNLPCFTAGDSRVNEQTLLTVMHTIWLREHNRIAEQLGTLNPGWNDEIIFRETRRIVIAQIQHITYAEFLPLLLGRKVMSSFKLTLKLAGYSYEYSSEINPGIINSFATAAFRFGHTLVESMLDMVADDGHVEERVPLFGQFFNPKLLYRNKTFDMLCRGMILQPSQAFDKYVSEHLTNRLFQPPGYGYGLDLVALNIQRGRDHGLPGYNEWREHCSLPRVKDFEDLANVMEERAAANFSRLYRSVDDIDLFPAGIAEKPLPDAILGPTFACIIAEQFRRLKHGDRLWYENGGFESSFREDQLGEIRKVTLSRILCDNADIENIQLVALLRPAEWNPVELCNSERIPRMDLRSWRNEPVWA